MRGGGGGDTVYNLSLNSVSVKPGSVAFYSKRGKKSSRNFICMLPTHPRDLFVTDQIQLSSETYNKLSTCVCMAKSFVVIAPVVFLQVSMMATISFLIWNLSMNLSLVAILT